MSIPSTEQLIERWQNALRVLDSMDEHERTSHLKMNAWGEITPCGTVACLAGHCSMDPWFKEQRFTSEFFSDKLLHFTQEYPSDFFQDSQYMDDTILYAIKDTFHQVRYKVVKRIAQLKEFAQHEHP